MREEAESMVSVSQMCTISDSYFTVSLSPWYSYIKKGTPYNNRVAIHHILTLSRQTNTFPFLSVNVVAIISSIGSPAKKSGKCQSIAEPILLFNRILHVMTKRMSGKKQSIKRPLKFTFIGCQETEKAVSLKAPI